MERDFISESPVKRQKTANGYRPQGPQHGRTVSTQEGLRHNTIPTQPLSHPPPAPTSGFSVAGLLSQIAGTGTGSSPYVTQPTQPVQRRYGHDNSTPIVEVNRSSPPPGAISSPVSDVTPRKPAAPSGLKRPGMGSRLAPAGTRFARPPGTSMARPNPVTINLDDDDDIRDPPIDRSSDDETQPMRSTIRPTEFTRGGRNLDSSPNRVKESPVMRNAEGFKSITSQFTYDPSVASSGPKRNYGDMASSYGSVSRNKPSPVARVMPSKVRDSPDLAIEDILDKDVQDKVQRMKTVLPGKSIKYLESVLRQKRGNYSDALSFIYEQEEDAVIDLTSSDIESNASKPAARPLKPAAKQEVKAPARTIQEKYANAQAKLKINATQTSAEPKKRRLVQGGRNTPASRTGSPSPEKVPGVASKRKVVVVDSDSEAEVDGGSDEEENLDFNAKMLKFFNSCTARDLADLSNEKLAIAEFILSKRPFRNLDAVTRVSNADPTKTGKRMARKTLGERVYDICSEMMEGYDAVDQLVDQCDAIGKPIFETMQQWGVDIAAATRDGELALTNLEESLQDSGIGTPASSVPDFDDDDVVRPKSKPKKKKNVFLKKPSIMSPDLVLKDYQLFGLNWLNLLWSKKLSCILADDMGLGKTCQVITFLAHLKEMEVPGTHLIVVPGSTLENWIRELQRFCPDLDVSPYYGSLAEREEWRRSFEDGAHDPDVIVTTYETATGKYDAPFFRKIVKPVVAVFDEGHHLKNSQSKRHTELMRIPAEFRLLLTGTPLQNNLQELVSLLAFILPKLISPEIREDLNKIFKYKATTKDADHAALLSAQRIKRARSMMTPFILRRKKAQVLKHLPAKHRRVEYCEMPPSQKELYQEMVAEALRMRGLSIDQKAGRGSGKLAQEMTALRFAALHPLLLRNKYTDKDLQKLQKALERSDEFGDNRPDQIAKYIKEDLKGGDYGLHKFCQERSSFLSRFTLQNDEWMVSGKVQKLKELMEAYIANGDRVLIFSQFTTMMNILEAVFENLNIKFMRLDGSTAMSSRQDIIDQFTTDESIPVFMLSTKAGGAGINLACANKVIIFDSSFNPQDDIQAENRAHRVGQTREVEVVRLVTRGTIEEQIHALGESKLALDERVAGGAAGESGPAEKKAEAEGEQKVEEMFFKALEQGDAKEEEKDVKDDASTVKAEEKDAQTEVKEEKTDNVNGTKKDLKDEFKDGLREAGLDVKDE